jgi:hypothetical protein
MNDIPLPSDRSGALKADDNFTCGDDDAFCVVEFWRWAFSDLQSNALRGVLAEYIVARALGIEPVGRASWDDYDLEMPDGTTVEVKSSAYLQSWTQSKPSVLQFGGLRGRTWSPEDGYSETQEYRADVYVFCVQTATTQEEYDPLDLEQWEFCVLPRQVLEERGTKSIRWSVVKRLASRVVTYEILADEVADRSR